VAAVKYDVLILSMAEDFHAQAVIDDLAAQALGAKLFNLSEFSMRWPYRWHSRTAAGAWNCASVISLTLMANDPKEPQA
jgi:hypothetical protein